MLQLYPFHTLKPFEVVIMNLASVLVLFVAISTKVIATSKAEFYGTWTMVKAFRDVNVIDDDDYRCSKYKFGPGATTNTCNDDELVSYSVQLGKIITGINLPGFIAGTHEEAVDFTHRPCQNASGGEFKVFRMLDNNYFIMYFSAPSHSVPDAALFAKAVPTRAELAAFLNNISGFEDKIKVTMCTY